MTALGLNVIDNHAIVNGVIPGGNPHAVCPVVFLIVPGFANEIITANRVNVALSTLFLPLDL